MDRELLLLLRRALCAVDERPLPAPGVHTHRCHKCGNEWSHDNELLMDPSCTKDEYVKAHTCSVCGTEVWLKNIVLTKE